MPITEVLFEFQAFRWDEPPVTDVEFLDALAISPGEVEEASSWREHWGQPFVRIATLRSEHPVPDDEFDQWASPTFLAVAKFLRERPTGVYNRLRAAGMQNLRLNVDLKYVGDFPIVDWPSDVYEACREVDIGLVSSYETPEPREPRLTPVSDEDSHSPFPIFELVVPPPDPRDWI